MRQHTFAVAVSVLILGVVAGSAQRQQGPPTPGLTLTTPAFEDGGIIPPRYTGLVPEPVTPKLEWTNVPANTASFVLVLHDPDTSVQRRTETILHWLVFNIPGTARELAEGLPSTPTLPDGSVQAKLRRGTPGYMGPGAPAAGPFHHYTFELYALDIKLELGVEATREEIMKGMDGHIVGKAVLVGRFHR